MKKRHITGMLLAGILLANPIVPLMETSAVHAATTGAFEQTKYNVSDLVNGKILQDNPRVVVSSVSGGAIGSDPYCFVMEYVGKGTSPTGVSETWWKVKRVRTSDGSVMNIQTTVTSAPIDAYPHLAPVPGQGVDFGASNPPNPVWATGSGTNVTPISGWNPIVKTENQSGFVDVPDSNPYVPYIKYLREKGASNGKGDGKFGPTDKLTRAEFAAFLVKALGLTESKNTVKFADSKGHWGANYIQTAFEASLVNGTSDTTFEPDAFVKREEAAIMVWRYLKTQGYTPTSEDIKIDTETDSWGIEHVKNIVANKLYGPEVSTYANGTWRYNPVETMNRQEAAAIIALTMQKLGK